MDDRLKKFDGIEKGGESKEKLYDYFHALTVANCLSNKKKDSTK